MANEMMKLFEAELETAAAGLALALAEAPESKPQCTLALGRGYASFTIWRHAQGPDDAVLVVCAEAWAGAGVEVRNEVEIKSNASAGDILLVLAGFVESALDVLGADPTGEAEAFSAAPPEVLLETPVECGAAARQVKVLKQSHNNACGYHVLFNAAALLGAPGVRGDCPRSFWANALRWMRMLERYNARAGVWGSASLRSMVLDTGHIRAVMARDPRLRGRAFAFESEAQMTGYDQSSYLRALAEADRQPVAIALGCVSHWTLALLDRQARAVTFADSHNKVLVPHVNGVAAATAAAAASIDEMSDAVLDAYEPSFIASMRQHATYLHLPDDRMRQLFVSGVEEFWKGNAKDSMYWRHRPRAVRHALLGMEMRASLSFLNRFVADVAAAELPGAAPPEAERAATLDELAETAAQAVDLVPSGAALLDATRRAGLRGFVRAEEEWPPDSVEYQSGNGIENRKKPPPPEVPGDVFDRQRVIVGFDQTLIERQACLVIGTGGVGQNTALTLARLGVARIILLDYDTVDPSNLTRQCLSGLGDVGARKVDAARASLEAGGHALRSRITTLHGDVLKLWPTVVALARTCTAIFNCADVGVMFDYSVSALAKELGVPVMSGQSFAWKLMVECYAGLCDRLCAFCLEKTHSSFGLNNLEAISRRLKDFGGAPDAAAFAAFLGQDRQFRVHGEQAVALAGSAWLAAAAAGGAPGEPAWLECALREYHDAAVRLLQPGAVSRNASLGFIPRPVQPETRFFGSWVCPCLTSGVIMVSQWTNLLTSPQGKADPPTHVVFNLDEGMTTEEQMSYELGMGLDLEERTFARSSPSDPACGLCRSAAQSDARLRRLRFGGDRVALRPVPGEVVARPGFLPAGCAGEPPAPAATGGLVFPAVPAKGVPLSPALEGPADPLLPPVLGTLPLVKVPLEPDEKAPLHPSTVEGVASGVRSAIVLAGGIAYRLKGCGNRDQGFPVEAHGDHGEEMVRGCMFVDTAARELYMTGLVNACLSGTGLRCANRPVGAYRYREPQLPEGAGSCFCAVFETVGDRRLGDHLLAGLERLLPRLFADVTPGTEAHATLEQALRAGRGGVAEGDDLWDTATTAECGLPVADLGDCAPREAASQELLEWRAEGWDDALAALWREAAGELAGFLDEHRAEGGAGAGRSAVFALARQVGVECGTVCRALEAGGISWGTYPDSTGIHCNSHANNLVVLTESVDGPLLAPLDFDMAFTREHFLPDRAASSHQAAGFPTAWDELVRFEQRMGMRTSLAGSDFTSTGVANAAAEGTGPGEPFWLIRTALRDTVVAGFDAGLGGNGGGFGASAALRGKAFAPLVRLALLTTHDAGA